MRAVQKHTECKWVLLYIQRWSKAPVQLPDGNLEARGKGTPQGSVVSPLLANLFLHYAFDLWMQRKYPSVPFERYADDVICHCKTEVQAKCLLDVVSRRMTECKLELNLEKTKIVYCKDGRRKRDYPNVKFDFLGYSFQPRPVKGPSGNLFIGFNPAVSNKVSKSMRDVMRSWQIHLHSDRSLEDLSRMYNPIIRGWVNYYSRYYRSKLHQAFNPLNLMLAKWAMRKYKRFKGHQRRASRWLSMIRKREPYLFAHWQMVHSPMAGR